MVKKHKSKYPRKIFLIAGEPSGDSLGGNLMEGLLKIYPKVEFIGVGGPSMIENGLVSIFPYDELSVMGITEVLSNLPRLINRKNQLVASILRDSFDVVVTIDSPDFNFRVAKGIKQGGYRNPVIHYVSPTVWAWRKGRVKKIRESVDHVLTLFPFENEILEKSGISSTFVGHPIANITLPDKQEIAQVSSHLGIEPDKPTLLILPGSRKSEITKMGPVFAKAAGLFQTEFSDYQIVVAPTQRFTDLLKDTNKFKWPEGTRFFESADWDSKQRERMKLSLFSVSNLALASSGTVSLELAATSTPMVIGYDLSWLSRQIIGSMLLVDTVTLVNLITSTRAVPELLGKKMTPEKLFVELKKIVSDPSEQNAQINILNQTMICLGKNAQNLIDLPAQSVAEIFDLHKE
ncbi:MAG: lipid-A-disaccharide synthase [Paracoccaceae bacterium]|nr:lipid-A-disaccharide synthase [Paracoccaceae bacterium]MDE2674535.1 lipid-A-disaccharide synthase [Paracoccaceae bacterium]